MLQSDTDKNFKFASSLIKVIAVVIALMVIVISRYAFIFFATAMLPTIFSFNLIGVMPYLIRVWEANSVDYLAQQLLADVGTWMIIYGAALIGQLLYASMPLLVVRIYSARMRVRTEKYEKQHKELCEQWGINTK